MEISRSHPQIARPEAPRPAEVPRTTKLYDRTGDTISLDEVERIAI